MLINKLDDYHRRKVTSAMSEDLKRDLKVVLRFLLEEYVEAKVSDGTYGQISQSLRKLSELSPGVRGYDAEITIDERYGLFDDQE